MKGIFFLNNHKKNGQNFPKYPAEIFKDNNVPVWQYAYTRSFARNASGIAVSLRCS